MTESETSVEMTRAEIDAFLSQVILARLATVRVDGRPHVTPIWFIWDGETIWMETGPDFVKARNLRDNPECAVVVDTTEGGLRIKGVILEGRAELVQEPNDLVTRVVTRLYERYMGSEAMQAATPRKMFDAPHVLIKLTPRKIISWDWTHQGIAPLL